MNSGWTVMQRVERCRYRAEQIEQAARHLPEPWPQLAADIAFLWRQLAEQIYAVSMGAEIPPTPPLKDSSSPRPSAQTSGAVSDAVGAMSDC